MLDERRLAQASAGAAGRPARDRDQRPRALLRRLGARPGRAGPAGRRDVVGRPPDLHDARPGPPARGRGRAGARASTAWRDSTARSGGPTRRRGSRARSWRSIPAPGEIRAMVGGRDYGQSQFNRVVPGAAAARLGLQAVRLPGGPRPRATGRAAQLHAGVAPRGLGRSRSAPAATPGPRATTRTGTRERSRCAGRSSSRSTPRRCGWRRPSGTTRSSGPRGRPGFTSPLEPVPALVLGSFEVTPLELAVGVRGVRERRRADPADRAPRRRRSRGRRQRAAHRAGRRRSRPDEAFLITHLLEGVIDRGTGASARALGVEGPVAGEDRDDERGPRHLVRRLHAAADRARLGRVRPAGRAAPVGRAGRAADLGRLHAHRPRRGPGRALRAAAPRSPSGTWTRATASCATAWCPVVIREAFLASTEPRETCPDHGPAAAVRSFFRRLFESGR